jgi:2',3'-cyclic-nucleotide 2'-phosphodiesterase (5'-nucleotidase family)
LGSYPHISADLEIEFDKQLLPNSRIIKALYKKKPIEEDQIYTIASSKYLLKGGDGFEILQNVELIPHENDGKLLKEAVEEYLIDLKEIKYPKKEFRIFETCEYNGWEATQSRLKF